jgi:radical SAM superfamily enzyme YgiQ (UPF0313 family)
VDEIKKDIDAMKSTGYYDSCDSAFLQDANSIVLNPDKTIEVLSHLKSKFPNISRITTYGRADTLSQISVEQYLRLKNSGLNRIHSGYESGSDKVLELIGKGTTKAQQIEAGKKIKESGIQLSIYFMPGVGGKEYSQENWMETADVINKINPDFLRIRTFVSKPGSGMQKDIEEGKLTECTDLEKALEIKHLIENIDSCDGFIVSDHIINLLEGVRGNLKSDKERLLQVFEEFESLSTEEREAYQIARRIGLVRSVEDMNKLNALQLNRVEELLLQAKRTGFESFLKELLILYI